MSERLEQEPQSEKSLRGKLHGLWQLRIGLSESDMKQTNNKRK
jgi:hypothetical protein